MNGQLILKEWKEKAAVPLFALVFLLIFVVVARVFAQRGEVLDILTGSIFLAFLPMTAVLLGASAFYSEFRDGAWAYLFSRPVKKTMIWISKFLALFAILAGTLFVYFIVLSRIPGVRERIAEFRIPLVSGETFSLWGVCLTISLSLFVIAFSLSCFSDKQIQDIFLSILVFAGFGLAFAYVIKEVLYWNPDFTFLIPVVWALSAISIGASSLVAFGRTDFSQAGAKIAGFLKCLVLFLALAAVVVWAAIGIGARFRPITHIRLETSGRNAYIYLSRGLYRFDSERNSLKRLDGAPWLGWGGDISAGGGKVVWSHYSLVKKNGVRDEAQELWIMDEDGRNKRSIFRSSDVQIGQLSGHDTFNFCLSRDGSRIVFLSQPPGGQDSRMLWSINSDGSGLRNYKINIPDLGYMYCLGWTADNQHVILNVLEKPSEDKSVRKRWLCKYSLETRAWQAFGENAWMTYVFGLSPKGDKFGASSPAPGAQPPALSGPPSAVVRPEILSAYDLDTLARTDLLRAPSISQAVWDPGGAKIAFLSKGGTRLGIYSMAEGKVLSETALGPSLKNIVDKSLSWAADGQKVVLTDLEGSRYILKIFDENLKHDKTYPIPQTKTIQTCPGVYGLGQKVLVLDFQSGRLWVFDLAKEKWRRLF